MAVVVSSGDCMVSAERERDRRPTQTSACGAHVRTQAMKRCCGRSALTIDDDEDDEDDDDDQTRRTARPTTTIQCETSACNIQRRWRWRGEGYRRGYQTGIRRLSTSGCRWKLLPPRRRRIPLRELSRGGCCASIASSASSASASASASTSASASARGTQRRTDFVVSRDSAKRQRTQSTSGARYGWTSFSDRPHYSMNDERRTTRSESVGRRVWCVFRAAHPHNTQLQRRNLGCPRISRSVS